MPSDRVRDAALLTKKVLLDPSTASRLLRSCTELHEGAFDMFRLAFRRFNQSFQRSDIDDRIVDLAIVLEATVLADAHNELFWRAQVLGEELLRSAMEPAGTARDHITALYDARSRIVHDGIVFGETFSGEPKWKGIAKSWKKIAATPEEFDTKMIELARRVLLATTARARSVKSPKEFRKKLEDAVVVRVPFE